MTGRRRQVDAVIARPIVAAVTAALALMSSGNMVALGCVIGWLRQAESSPGVDTAVWLFTAALAAHLIGGTVALVAWAWSR